MEALSAAMRARAAHVYKSTSSISTQAASPRIYPISARPINRRQFHSISSQLVQAAATQSLRTAESQPADTNRPAALDAKDRDLLNKGLDNTATVGSTHTPRHKTPSAQTGRDSSSILFPTSPSPSPSITATTTSPITNRPGSSFLDLSREYQQRAQQQPSSRPNPILFPQSPPSSSSYSSHQQNHPPPVLSNTPYQSLHLSTRKGRTLEVNPSNPTDLGSRLRQLGGLIGRNRIRQDMNRQKFHERPGLKRKRLVSERWRRRFKDGFVRMVGRVQELRRQGW